ncbi:MAG: hypothetical protein JWM41_205 [Gemmatimonadetes bacterium]|nr:hypothetical protein [Gemmatimonadota bacterium]
MLLCAFAALTATAQQLSAQTSSISVTSPSALSISAATAGGQPVGQSTTASYSVTVVGGRKKITAQLEAPLPPGVTLTISLAAPSGAVSLGSATLSTSSRDMVRYIAIGQYTSLTVTLSLNASVSAGVVPFNYSHVVLTLVDDP